MQSRSEMIHSLVTDVLEFLALKGVAPTPAVVDALYPAAARVADNDLAIEAVARRAKKARKAKNRDKRARASARALAKSVYSPPLIHKVNGTYRGHATRPEFPGWHPEVT